MLDAIKKLKETFIDSTFGLLFRYQKNVLSLAKIHTALFYLKSIQALRKQVLFVVGAIFTLLFLAVALVVAPFMIVLVAPIAVKVKFFLICFLAVLDLGVPSIVLAKGLSEKKWMELFKSDELMESALK